MIDYPHIVAQYMHLRNSQFRQEILQKGMNVEDFWCRFEWQHKGSTHVHGFLWIKGETNMDAISWLNK